MPARREGASRVSRASEVFPGPFIRRMLQESAGRDSSGLEGPRPFHCRRVDRPGDTSRRWVVTFPAFQGASARRLLVKQYRGDPSFRHDVANEFRGLSVANKAFGGDPCVAAPRPYAYDPDENAIVMEYCAADTLSRRLFHGLRWSAWIHTASQRRDVREYAAKAGLLLRRLQAIPPGEDVGARPEDALRRALVRYEEHFERSVAHCERQQVPAEQLARIRAYVSDTLRVPPEPTLVVQHSDFGPWNLLLGEGRVYAVDFHDFGHGVPAYDASYFHTALELWTRYRTVDRAAVDEAQGAFAAALAGGPTTSAPPWPLFDVLSVIHKTYLGSVILSQRPRARELAYVPLARRDFVRDWFRIPGRDR